ncbi:glutaminyl-peptide cyclotransferase [Flavobacterium reichenbachii]|uniref:Glutamine cyclotransferase n=1 Tax=Flavobacterium reichenbachii TaxID=362418 RepID=A0A085ZMD7_9FLAO|nr:glutaminyl-peptide cyclotransferase [Flavobacterium reichenbachii]KFF05601.1 glutamine cyclotransferase [Flavobacterium reichenbachii]OXB17935.1 glutamine cyclotransferase [Flavobacterium reichenbachii]
MKKYNFLTFILLGITLIGCNGAKKGENSLFNIDDSAFPAHFTSKEAVSFNISNPNSKEIDSIAYFVNDKKVGSTKGTEKFKFELKDQKLGYQYLKATIYFGSDSSDATKRIELVSNVEPKALKFKIVNTYPHDTKSFTEGLEFHDGVLYESTGQKGDSYIREIDYKTGKVLKQVDLDQKYFGEGITFINGKLFQLSWQEKTGFIYDAKTLKLEKTFKYDKEIEGWGMTNDGKYIYQSDGTEKIWKVDPADQKHIDYINVYSGNSKIKAINELELINGKFYANVFQKDAIAIIDPNSGAVEGILNMAELRKQLKFAEPDVLNGIAYNPATKTIFVTGKYWDKMFEITVSE